MAVWHIITGEYPPQLGGVSDYTRLVSHALTTEGNSVHVWAPECGDGGEATPGLAIHRLPGHFGPAALAALSRSLRRSPAHRLLVQYVPHAYGFKAMNLSFCLWLTTLRHNNLTIMFHEVIFPLHRGQPLKHQVLGVVTRIMAWLVSRSATRIMVASARAETILRQLGATAPISWVPVPSNIPVVGDATATGRLRQQYAGAGGLLLGNFSNYSAYSLEHLGQVVSELLAADGRLSLLLLGGNSVEFRQRLLGAHPEHHRRIHATGRLEPHDLSCRLAACDLMIQPYPDGVSTRRSSMMAALAHGRATVTTSGTSTEPLWPQSRAVVMAPAGDPGAMRSLIAQTIADPDERCRYTRAARELYTQRFALRHTIAALLAA